MTLPERGQAAPQPASGPSGQGSPAAVPGDGRLPQGATHWSKAYYDAQGVRRTARHVRPVNRNGQVVADAYGCTRCDGAGWFPPNLKQAPLCPGDGRVMRLRPDRSWLGDTVAGLPWAPMWRSVDRRLWAVWAGGAVAAAGVATDSAAVPGWWLAGAALPAGLVARRVGQRVLLHRAAKRGGIDRGNPGGDRRARATIARWARTAGYCTAAACGWTALAASTGLDPHTAAADVSWTVLAAAWAYPAFTWWRWLRSQRRLTAPQSAARVTRTEVVTVDPFEVEVVATWAARVAAVNGILPNTRLSGFRYIKGGWAATVVSDSPGSIAPERWHSAAGRVAAAYRCGIQDVSLELDGGDASQATVRVQKENPLCEVLNWPGPAATWNFRNGTLWVGRFGDDEPSLYRWWNETGPWHDLIAGATGSGKSVLVKTLILAGLNSQGLVLDRVIDPQWGQSFGDLQDHVDWFAPDISEARLLLLDTVKQMIRRNRGYSRVRQETWKPTVAEPLIVVTIDEAHEVLKDPVCLALVEKLAKLARKTGIKLRLITQVPTVTEIGNSTPIKDALLGGNLIVFRTGSAVSTNVSIGPVLPVDPHRLPPEWPKGSPGAGKTTAGLGFIAGASRRPVPWRSWYVADMRPFLCDGDGNLTITPGVAGPAMVAESGVLWSDRKARVAALFESPTDDDAILPEGLVEALTAAARVGARQLPLLAATAALRPVDEDGTARTAVLMAAMRHADDVTGRVAKQTLAERTRAAGGKPLPARTLTHVLTTLVAQGVLLRPKNGVYEVTDQARHEVSRAADALVAAMVGPESQDSDEGGEAA